MNKFSKQIVLGLSCLGALSVVSCDNETETPKVPPVLEKVSFSSAASGVTFAEGQKVTLNIKDGDNEAKYYTDNDRVDGTLFGEDGTEFTFNADKSIKGGFYLESATGNGKVYKLTKFDYTVGTGDDAQSYTLKGDKEFKVVTGTTTEVAVDVVEKTEGSVESGGKASGTSVSFGVKKSDVEDNEFNVVIYKADGTVFNSTTDKTSTIKLDVKDGDTVIYTIANLFTAIGEADSSEKHAEVFKIALPRELTHYTSLTITGTVKPNDGTAKTLTVKSGTIIADKKIALKES